MIGPESHAVSGLNESARVEVPGDPATMNMIAWFRNLIGSDPGVLAHHPYDYIVGFGIALAGMLLIFWAERRVRSRNRSPKSRDRI